MTSVNTYKGSCLCGEVTFSFTAALTDVWFCHCTQCRKNYGTYGTFVGVPRGDLKIQKKRKLRTYQSTTDVTRSFCGTCGSPIAWDKAGLAQIYILAGLIEGKVKAEKGTHIHVQNKGGYYQICDGFPQYKRVPK